jgi:hypothetical protein
VTDPTFYVAATKRDSNPRIITGYVPSTFLMRNGSYVVDPFPGGSQTDLYLYSDASGSNRTPGAIANPNNYVIVPKIHDEADARRAALGSSGSEPLADSLARDQSLIRGLTCVRAG